jgi:hypothetical protein
MLLDAMLLFWGRLMPVAAASGDRVSEIAVRLLTAAGSMPHDRLRLLVHLVDAQHARRVGVPATCLVWIWSGSPHAEGYEDRLVADDRIVLTDGHVRLRHGRLERRELPSDIEAGVRHVLARTGCGRCPDLVGLAARGRAWS